MSTTAIQVRNFSIQAGAPGADELLDWSFGKIPADPALPGDGTEWINTADGRRRWRSGATTHTYAHLTDVTGAWKSRGTHSTNALPTAATATIDTGAVLANYNTFLMTNAAPVTIAGIQGSPVLNAGDVLVLMDAAAPAVAASWLGIQRNMEDASFITAESVTLASLPADTATAVPMANLTNIRSYEVESTTGLNIKDAIIAVKSGPATVTLTSSVAMTNVVVVALGTV